MGKIKFYLSGVKEAEIFIHCLSFSKNRLKRVKKIISLDSSANFGREPALSSYTSRKTKTF